MATYGIGVPGQVPFTGYSNVLGSESGGQVSGPATSGYIQQNGIQQTDAQQAKLFHKGGLATAYNAIFRALITGGIGTLVQATHTRTQHYGGDNLGGIRPINTAFIINRNANAADVTAFTALSNRQVYPATYPPDLSGNGGGGKGAW